ncbi:MAG: hypothetical protein GY714_18095 [Desulfobacterales bacterium]|nr:hypothetical protein [Desulfobacterales bacterium]
MPDLPLNQKPYTNVPDIGNTVAIQGFIDADKDDFMNNTFRHGLGGNTNNYFANISSKKIDGIFDIINYGFAAVFSGGRLYKVTEDGTATEITGVTINTGIMVSFADFGDVGFFCNNSAILKWTYADSTCSFIADTDAPTDAIFLGFLNQYLIALKANSQRFEFADVGDPDKWLGEGYIAESRPDLAVCLFSAFGEILIPGTKTLENWADSGDPTSPFQRIPGTITERGSLSPYSFAQVDNSYFFIDSDRRVIRLAGRDPQVISNPFDNEFQSLSSVADAIGFHFNAEGSTKYVITFPDAQKTFAYDYKLDFWSEWSYWNHTTGTRSDYIGRTGCFIPKWNKYIVGSNATGKLYIASREYSKDEGTDIIPEIITSRVDWGSQNRKASSKLRIKIERGTNGVLDTDAPKIYFAKRDDGKKQWSRDREIDLGIAGDTYSYATFRQLGTYRDRQYRFRMQGAISTISRATEEIEAIT